VVSTLPLVYLPPQILSLFWLDALLEDSRHAAVVQFIIDDGVRLCVALESPGFCFILRQVPSDEVVAEWLHPGWYLPDVEDASDQRVRSPGSIDVLASSSWPAARAGLETAAPESFAELATLGWPAASFSSEAAAPESGSGA
jgi:hypothetical protein